MITAIVTRLCLNLSVHFLSIALACADGRDNCSILSEEIAHSKYYAKKSLIFLRESIESGRWFVESEE